MGPWSSKIKSLNSLPAINSRTPHLHCAISPLAPTVWILCPLIYERYVFHGSNLFLTNKSSIFPSIFPQFKLFGQITNIYHPLFFNLFADFMTSHISYFYLVSSPAFTSSSPTRCGYFSVSPMSLYYLSKSLLPRWHSP